MAIIEIIHPKLGVVRQYRFDFINSVKPLHIVFIGVQMGGKSITYQDNPNRIQTESHAYSASMNNEINNSCICCKICSYVTPVVVNPLYIKMTSHVRHGVSNHRLFDRLFKSLLRLTSKKAWKVHIAWPFVKGIHRLPVDVLTNGPVMRKAFSYHDVTTAIFGQQLTHLPLVSHICISELGQHWFSNGLSPVRRQATTWTNADLLLIINKRQWKCNQNTNLFF